MRIDWLLLYSKELERLNVLYQMKNDGKELTDDELEEYEQLVDEIGMYLPVVTG